jgi:hypothetical protein
MKTAHFNAFLLEKRMKLFEVRSGHAILKLNRVNGKFYQFFHHFFWSI